MEFEENLNLLIESIRNQVNDDEILKNLFNYIFSDQRLVGKFV
jgi:hypothetical protein